MNIFLSLFILSLLSTFCYSIYIRIFKGVSQTEREEGLLSHKRKNGTITIGGIFFLILPLIFLTKDLKTLQIFITALLYGIIGLIDDLLIVVKKNNKGIGANLKLFMETIIASISFIIYLNINDNTVLNLYFFSIDIKWIFGMFLLFYLNASANAFNLTDGIDGLCGGLSILISIAFIINAYKKKEYQIMYLICIVSIPLFIFWCFNLPKAFLFMGDTGSLFLGSFYAMISIYLDSILGFIIMALLFIFEVLSVIIQVFYFKKTNGKRLFKMAPFHHHLESIGINEIKIDLLFYLIEIVLIIIVFLCHLF